jgi:hypothetical protein
MLWAVAARFGFSEAELWAMPISRLKFWFRGHAHMIDEERRAAKGLNGK